MMVIKKSPPRIKLHEPEGPVETVEEFVKRGGKIEVLEQAGDPPKPNTIPVGFGRSTIGGFIR